MLYFINPPSGTVTVLLPTRYRASFHPWYRSSPPSSSRFPFHYQGAVFPFNKQGSVLLAGCRVSVQLPK